MYSYELGMAQYYALANGDSNKFYIVHQKEDGVVVQVIFFVEPTSNI